VSSLIIVILAGKLLPVLSRAKEKQNYPLFRKPAAIGIATPTVRGNDNRDYVPGDTSGRYFFASILASYSPNQQLQPIRVMT
jgi:hypothetical protein